MEPMVVANPSDHTMGVSLTRYVEARVHEWVEEADFSEVFVIPSYNRDLAVSHKEKRDKRENWQRPTASVQAKTLEIHCFPGRAHVFHHDVQ